jgi:hypothetical protein
MASDRPLTTHVKSIGCAQIIFNISISHCETIRALDRPLKITDVSKVYGEKKILFKTAILYCETIRASDRSLNNECTEYRVRSNYFTCIIIIVNQ